MEMDRAEDIKKRLMTIFHSDERPLPERRRLIDLMMLPVTLPPPPDPLGLYPDYSRLRDDFIESTFTDDPDRVEERFLELYCHLHGYEAPYTSEERRRVDETGGYWCHAGGLSPILKAEPWIGPDTVSADFGAGNGLQGLLMQKLYPHKLTIQIEISSRMVACGKTLQEWLSIDPDRVEWRIEDVLDASPKGKDFIYLYRPVKPVAEGRAFYERFAAELEETGRPVVIFSIADCLKEFLSSAFEVFYHDGHLTCFKRP